MNTTPETNGTDTPDAAPQKRSGKGRRRKWMLVPLILFIGLIALLMVRNSLIWPRVVEQVEKDFKVTLELDEFNLAPTLNGLALTGLSVRDLSGREIVRMDSFEVQFGLIGALFGSTEVSVDVSGLELTVWEESEGVFNLANLAREKAGESSATDSTLNESAPEDSADEKPESAGSTEDGFEFVVRSLVHLDQIQLTVLEFQNDELVPAFESITLNTDLDATVELEANGAVQAKVAKFDSDTQFHSGSFSGDVELPGGDSSFLVAFQELTGSWSVQPNRIGDAFGIELPAEFTADARETFDFGLSGSIPSTELPAMLSDLSGELNLGIMGVSAEGLSLDGNLITKFVPGAIELDGKFDSNGGTIKLDGRLVPNHQAATADDPAFSTGLLLDHVQLGSESSKLLSFLHPAFASLKTSEAGTVDAVADAHIKLAYGEAIPWEVMASEDPELSMGPLKSSGSVTVNELKIQGSPLVDKMIEELGGGSDGTIRLRPVKFDFESGRLRYSEPWTWTIADSETTFDGSMGLEDQSLDMMWNVPITDGLVKRHRVLRKLKGKTLKVPILGTVTNPTVDFGSVIENAGESLLDGFLPSLGGNADPEVETPEKMLQKANKLWDDKRFVEAAALYNRIRSEHKLTLLYTLNRKLIKKRSAYKE